MNTKLTKFMQSMPHLLMIRTSEEDRLIREMHSAKDEGAELHVWNVAFGMMSSDKYIDEWDRTEHPTDKATAQLNPALIQMYQTSYCTTADGEEGQIYYMVLDADRFMTDSHVQRRLRNIAVSGTNSASSLRTVILVSDTGYVPPNLEPYVHFVDFDHPSDEVILQVIDSVESSAREVDPTLTIPTGRDFDAPVPEDFLAACRGLTVFQLREHLYHTMLPNAMRITVDDMREFRKEIIQKTSLLDLAETDETFEDVAGLENLKERLTEVRYAFTKEGREYGVPACKGLLQVGIPGCGKSLIAKALANEMDVPFIKFDPSALFSSRVGDSERNMRQALQHIQAVSPCVVFIDEIEKGLAGIQSSSFSDSGTTARVIGTFLSWFQDHDDDIFIIATANGIHNLPPELISRFEEKYFVGLPTEEAREACFQIQFDKYWKDTMGDYAKLDFKAMAKASVRLTGREIEQVVKDSIRKAFGTKDKKLTTELVVNLCETKPPLVYTMHEDIFELLTWVGWDAERQEGIRARFASAGNAVESEIEGVLYDADSDEETTRLAKLFGKKDVTVSN